MTVKQIKMQKLEQPKTRHMTGVSDGFRFKRSFDWTENLFFFLIETRQMYKQIDKVTILPTNKRQT